MFKKYVVFVWYSQKTVQNENFSNNDSGSTILCGGKFAFSVKSNQK